MTSKLHRDLFTETTHPGSPGRNSPHTFNESLTNSNPLAVSNSKHKLISWTLCDEITQEDTLKKHQRKGITRGLRVSDSSALAGGDV